MSRRKLATLKPRLQTLASTLPVLTPGSWRAGRGSGAAGRMYGRRWEKRRVEQLRREPLCKFCLERGEARPATVADHIAAHRGDPALFEGALQSLCASCHSSRKQAEEQS